MNFNIPAGAQHILSKLNAAGYEAYLVGGCVRDILRDVQPHDWDICTSALPAQVQACFSDQRMIAAGLKHGTVTIVHAGEAYEVTTYRVDGAYSDGRRPDNVQFVSSLTADLARRDFTINAIAMDIDGVVRDPFLGAEDIRCKVIRCVGNPDHRFREDGLRIMRALRFAAAFGFSIEDYTAKSIHHNKRMLSNVAAERVNVELCKLLMGSGAAVILKEYIGVLCEFWCELGAMVGVGQDNHRHGFDVWNHTIAAVAGAPRDRVLRLTMLLHDIGKPQCFSLDANEIGHFYRHAAVGAALADEMLRRLKFDNDTRAQVVALVANHDAELPPENKIICRWLNKLGEQRFAQLLEVKRADCMAQQPDTAAWQLEALDAVAQLADEIIATNQCFALRDLAIDGNDVIAAGGMPGQTVGAVLNFIMDRVIDSALPNERAILLEAIAQLVRKQ